MFRARELFHKYRWHKCVGFFSLMFFSAQINMEILQIKFANTNDDCLCVKKYRTLHQCQILYVRNISREKKSNNSVRCLLRRSRESERQKTRGWFYVVTIVSENICTQAKNNSHFLSHNTRSRVHATDRPTGARKITHYVTVT